MIDETKPRIPCWLVWSTNDSGLVTLESISLNYKHAKYAKEVILENRGNIVSVKIEPSECNHMFDGNLDNIWMKNFGDDSAKALVDFHTEEKEKDLTLAKKLGTSLIRAIGRNDSDAIRKISLDWMMIFGMYQQE